MNGVGGNTYYTNEINDGANTHIYRASTFLDASNFFVSYKLRLDKSIAWNPVVGHGQAIPGGTSIKLNAVGADGTHDGNGSCTIITNSISGDDTASGEERSIQKGMVLESYDNPSGGSNQALTEPAIVSKIEYDSSTSLYTIFFRAYNGGDDDLDSSGVGSIDDIIAGDDLYFKQYSMNGLSPNSAKNLNYFRDGGLSAGKTGTEALGYTIEFVKQKPSIADDQILPANPAVWETEPKEDKDLDIYYEASEAYPITTDATNLANIIPVGSIIEHFSSNSVPPNTKIVSIDAGGVITTDNSIEVIRTIEDYMENLFR